MIDIANINISEFLTRLGSSDPAPGGGSAAALSGAIGAALVSMLCNLTLGREKYSEYQELASETLKKSDSLVLALTECINKDMNAYNSVMSALRMPKNTDAEKNLRSKKLQEAYRLATSAPEDTINNCLEVMRLAKSLVGKSNISAACDLAAAAFEAKSGIDIAMLSINANLSAIKDSEYVAKTRAWSENAELEAENLLREILEAI